MIEKTMPSLPPSVATRIASLSTMPMEDLKRLWKQLFHKEAPTHVRTFLERRIAYKIQEIEFRKIDPALLERNQRRIANLFEQGKALKRDKDFRPVEGTLLTREYRGQEFRVRVLAGDQYEFEGRLYPTLSMIAREITGTRWSGPLFFGLKKPSPKKHKGARK